MYVCMYVCMYICIDVHVLILFHHALGKLIRMQLACLPVEHWQLRAAAQSSLVLYESRFYNEQANLQLVLRCFLDCPEVSFTLFFFVQFLLLISAG